MHCKQQSEKTLEVRINMRQTTHIGVGNRQLAQSCIADADDIH
jgi:hypothetical protein